MAKTTIENNEELQKKLDGIIERTKAQNRILNKILNEINKEQQILQRINNSQDNH